MNNTYESISKETNGFTKSALYHKVLITPDMARKMMKHNNHNRPMRKDLILSYRKDIERGQFEHIGDSIRFDINGNMIDAQHRCQAVIFADKSITCNVETGLPLTAYPKMDQGRKRTVGDMLHSYDISNSKIVGSAITLMINMNNKELSLRSSVPNSVVDDWVRDNKKLLPLLIECATIASRILKPLGKKLSPNHVCALLFIMRQTNNDKALSFFENLSNYGNIPMDKDNPIYQLYQRLYKPGPESKRIDRVEALALTIKAYTFWLNNKKISLLKWIPSVEGFPKIP